MPPHKADKLIKDNEKDLTLTSNITFDLDLKHQLLQFVKSLETKKRETKII